MATTVVIPLACTPGTIEWLTAKIKSARYLALQIASDSKPFVSAIRDLQQHAVWDDYFEDEPKTWERFCRDVLEAEPEFVGLLDQGVALLEQRQHEGAIPGHTAITVAISAKPKPTTSESLQGNQNAKKDKETRNGNYNVIPVLGNSQKYLAARIARDRPDILEEMKAGKYRSVRAAAIDAGIVKVPTSLESAEKAFLKLSKDERETFLIWVSEL